MEPPILAGMAGLTVALFTAGAMRRSPAPMIRRRVQDLEDTEVTPQQQSFMERVVGPMLGAMWAWSSSVMPGTSEAKLAHRLDAAGVQIPVARFIAAWAGFGVLLPLMVILVAVALRAPGLSVVATLMIAWIGAGVAAPGYLLGKMTKKRVDVIERSLSDAMDLIVTNVEAGVGLQAALINVSEKLDGPLTDELSRAIREISLGRPRDEVLEAMARRTGSREMALFARAIAQAERNGVPIARVLRAQSGELRERRRQAARERANTFPLRITLLTVIFIFPTLFLLILGPVALNVLDFFANR